MDLLVNVLYYMIFFFGVYFMAQQVFKFAQRQYWNWTYSEKQVEKYKKRRGTGR